LKEIIDENYSKIKFEFEFENRIQWIENRIELLNKIIKELQELTEEVKEEVKEEEEDIITDEVEVVDEVVDVNEDEVVVGCDNILKTNPNENIKNDQVSLNNQNLINEILPPKPETLLSLPKPTKSPSETQSKDSLIFFSNDIQSEHDNLTNELIATVQLIKRNNLNIQKMVKSDDKIITEATGLLATNSDSMQKEGKNLKSYSKTAWVSFWKMLGILFFVCFTFIFVYIFIRLT